MSNNRPASLIRLLAINKQLVTPSPQAFSCDCASATNAFAAGCFTNNSATIFAPSLVTAVCPFVLYIILSRPFGPKVPANKSPKAIAAPTNFLVTSTPEVTDVVGETIATGARPEPSFGSDIIPWARPRLDEPSFNYRQIISAVLTRFATVAFTRTFAVSVSVTVFSRVAVLRIFPELFLLAEVFRHIFK